MNILVVCQYYFPEPFRITDICEELVRKGNNVTVLTGLPNYPMGRIYEGYKDKSKLHEFINGVEIYRSFTIGRRQGAIWRFLNYYSYAVSSSLKLRKLKKDFDVIFVNQLSPVMMANAAIKYKKKYNKKLVMYCLDLWPESLVLGGIKRNSLIYKFFHNVSEKIYKKADNLLITSKSFSEYFENEFGIKNTQYLPQYAEEFFDYELCKKQPDENIDIMFAGNVGVAQSVETIIKAANLTKDIPNLRWHIVGDGISLENCRNLARQLDVKSVVFHGRKPLEDMPKYYSMADAMLITMKKDPIISMTLPGKVQSYMAAGKPIIGAIDGETNFVINDAGCGFCQEAENELLLAESVRRFINYENKDELSKNALDYYKSNFTKNKFISELANVLEENMD